MFSLPGRACMMILFGDSITQKSFSMDGWGAHLAAQYARKDVWRRQTGKLHPTKFAQKIGGCEDLIKRLELYGSLEGHDGCVNTIHFNPSGDLLVSGSDDKEIVIWDWAAKTKKLSYCSGHTNNVFQARIMPFSDDRSIVSCAADGQVMSLSHFEYRHVTSLPTSCNSSRIPSL